MPERGFEKIEHRIRELGGEDLGGMDSGELARMDAEDLSDFANSFIDPGDANAAMYKLLRQIYQEWELRFARSEDFHAALLKRANVIAGTCIGIAGVKGMQDLRFDLCIVDEASKATATEVLVPLSRSRRWILVGDQRQLPPFKNEVVRQPSILQHYDLEASDLEQTLFDHLLRTLPEGCRRSLLTQYRMVPAIGNLISYCFYERKIKSAGREPDPHLAAVLPVPVVWFSTAQLRDHEEIPDGSTFKNRCEALVIRKILGDLNQVAAAIGRRYKVAVLTGYSAQRMELKRAFAGIAGLVGAAGRVQHRGRLPGPRGGRGRILGDALKPRRQTRFPPRGGTAQRSPVSRSLCPRDRRRSQFLRGGDGTQPFPRSARPH